MRASKGWSVPRLRQFGRVLDHPLPTQAVKSGIAAAIAWQLGTLLPGALPQHAYFAALGAVSVMYLALTDSLMEGVRVVVSLTAGVLIACGVSWVWSPNAVTIGVAIAIGATMAGVRWLGAQAGWLPLSSLFALTSSAGVPLTFSVDYVLQVTLGAGVGLLVNAMILPPLALFDVRKQALRVRLGILDQLIHVARALRSGEAPMAEQWAAKLAELPPARVALRGFVSRARRARSANPRARRWRRQEDEQLRVGDAFERLSWLVEDVGIVFYEGQQDGTTADDPELAHRAAEAIEATAAVLAEPVDGLLIPRRDSFEDAEDRIDKAVDHALTTSHLPRDQRIIAAAAVLRLRTCLHTLRTVEDDSA